MWGLDAPTAVSWPAGPGTNFLLDVYDWDTVTVGPAGAGAELTSRVVLCTAFYLLSGNRKGFFIIILFN